METRSTEPAIDRDMETARIKMGILVSQRPSAFRSTLWHGVFRVLYIFLGVITFIVGAYLAAVAYHEYTPTQKATRSTEDTATGIGTFISNIDAGFYMAAALLIFLFSILFFTLARYCRKIIRRNLYIIEVEGVWENIVNSR